MKEKETKKSFEIRKNVAIAELLVSASHIMEQLANDPGLDAATLDRLAHIERGELWLTPAAIKYAPLFAQLDIIRSQIFRIRSTAWADAKRHL